MFDLTAQDLVQSLPAFYFENEILLIRLILIQVKISSLINLKEITAKYITVFF